MKENVSILLVEDSPLDAELTLEHLGLAGIQYTSERVETRDALVKTLERKAPDLILCDYSLPEFDGLSALQIAQQLTPDVPVIFVSGVMGEEVAIETLKRGATDYVLKQRLGRLGFAVKRALAEAQERSERKQAEEALARKAHELMILNADLEQFAYAASHDLQEPLRTISIFSRLLANRYRPLLDQQGNEYLTYIESAAQHMSALLEDLLLYAKIPAQERDVEVADLNQVLEQTLFLFQVAIADAKASITFDKLPQARVNASQIGLVFQNLIGNALKYRGEQPPAIHIGLEERGANYVFCVSDNGAGFEQAYADQVFGLFKRLNGRESTGTGLGLSICKRIVEVHEGRIWAESQPGVGSTFFFTLPIRRNTSRSYTYSADGSSAGTSHQGAAKHQDAGVATDHSST